MTKTERWLNLLAFLLGRGTAAAREDILSQVQDYKDDWNSADDTRRESARRKFERDKKELKALGVELEKKSVWAEHADQEVEGYQLHARDFYLPYLDVRTGGTPRRSRPYSLASVALESAEVPILRRAAQRVAQMSDHPLASAGQSALRKLSFDLPELALPAGEHLVTTPVSEHFGRAFKTLFDAVRDRRAVKCRYYAIGRDQEETRVIEPYGMMLSWGSWYCVGRSRERDAMRVFRVDRMREVEVVSGAKGAFKVPKGFKIEQYLKRAPWELTDTKPITVRIEVAFPQSRWVIGEGLGKVLKAVTDDGGAELEFAVRAQDPFLRWLLTFGHQVKVLEPAPLRRQLDALRASVAKRYA